MAKKTYFSMNNVPEGTEMIIKETGEKVTLIEIINFPTTFKTKNEDGEEKNYYTYEVDIIDWPPSE
tara:strand:+ start:984 stop:1181 length:198 start_codon:yes stop_codon:yes gene_type:complete